MKTLDALHFRVFRFLDHMNLDEGKEVVNRWELA